MINDFITPNDSFEKLTSFVGTSFSDSVDILFSLADTGIP